MKNSIFFSLFFLLLFSACRKDVNEVKVNNNTENPIVEQFVAPVENIVGDLIGFVVDENNNPVTDAMVKLGNETVATDEYGHFFYNGKTMNSLGSIVKVEKSGYFNGSRRFFPKNDAKNRVKIQLLPKVFDQSFSSTSGGSISLNNGNGSVEFAANSIQKSDGSLYEGTVRVASKWLDPTAPATLDQMPGNLVGVNADIEQAVLGSYSMIAVELRGDNDEYLNILAGQKATISFPVAQSLLNNAPTSIPLWSYNEEYGYWVEESSATLQGGNYVGEVSHFSFWNCDVNLPTVTLGMTIVDANGDPLENVGVRLTLTGTTALCSYGYTDENGSVAGLVPSNEEILLEVIGLCWEVVHSQTISPLNADTDLGNIVVTLNTVNATTVSGTLLNCAGTTLTNGLVIASFANQTTYQYTDTGNFSITLTTCSGVTDVEVTAIDLDDLVSSAPQIVPANTQTDLGVISACGTSVDHYIILTIDGVTQIYPNPVVNVSPDGTYIYLGQNPNNVFVGFGFNGDSVGNYDNDNFIEGISDPDLGWQLNNNDNFTSFEVTTFDTDIIGTFSGQFDNVTPVGTTVVSVSGSFKVAQ
ncbi:MAG: hypothetical protein AB8G15_21930 [Saprospiraceae bacterium]